LYMCTHVQLLKHNNDLKAAIIAAEAAAAAEIDVQYTKTC